MGSGINLLTVWGPESSLNRLINTAFEVSGSPDISGYVYIDTYKIMYFGSNIKMLVRGENSITISYSGYGGTFIMYLEAILLRYRKCFLKNTYTDETKTEQWMGRIKNGKVEVLSVEPDTEGITNFEIIE
jgi:hypothetical protein